VVEQKYLEYDACLKSEPKTNKGNEKRKYIINANPRLPLFPPPRSKILSPNIQRRVSISFTHICG